MVQLTSDGVVLESANNTEANLGVLNGIFFTDADTNKPTFAKLLQSK